MMISLVGLAALPVVAGAGLGIHALGIGVEGQPLVLTSISGVLLALVMAGLTLCISVWVPRQTTCIFVSMGPRARLRRRLRPAPAPLDVPRALGAPGRRLRAARNLRLSSSLGILKVSQV